MEEAGAGNNNTQFQSQLDFYLHGPQHDATPQASQGLKVQLGASAPFGACGVGTETTGPT